MESLEACDGLPDRVDEEGGAAGCFERRRDVSKTRRERKQRRENAPTTSVAPLAPSTTLLTSFSTSILPVSCLTAPSAAPSTLLNSSIPPIGPSTGTTLPFLPPCLASSLLASSISLIAV